MRSRLRSILALAAATLAAACTDPAPDTVRAAAAAPLVVVPPPLHLPVIHNVTIDANGNFSPMWTYVHSGDFVVWHLHDRTDSIIPATWSGNFPAVCSTRKAFDPTDPNQMLGPMPVAATGVYTLGPTGAGLVEQAVPCADPTTQKAAVGGLYLCETGADGATMDSTWQSADVTGVFIRAKWKDLEPTQGNYTFAGLDAEIDKAVANGKLYSLGVKAGDYGTPDWIFSTNQNGTARAGGGGGVPRLHFEDDDSAITNPTGCTHSLDLGSPTDATYQQLYLDLLTELAEHIKERADRYRALAYIKPSGANFFSHENRLPDHCATDLGCPCNTQTWATGGYTPTGLYDFYIAQTALLAAELPGKSLSYALIQEGFPRVNDSGDYMLFDGSSSGAALPGTTEQTQHILDDGQATYGSQWVVQHNGLGPTLAPNYMVLAEGAQGQYTGFQTNALASPTELDQTFQNEWNNSGGQFLEIYEDDFWEAEHTAGGVLPSGNTIGTWATQLDTRHPFPLTYAHRFTRTLAGPVGNQLLYYIHGSKCNVNGTYYGVISIQP